MQKPPDARDDAPAPPDAMTALLEGTNGDPFSILGPRVIGGTRHVTVLQPGAVALWALCGGEDFVLSPVDGTDGVFAGPVPGSAPYRLRARADDGTEWAFEDTYRFGPVRDRATGPAATDGADHRLWEMLGAHVITHEGIAGTHFAVWAPNARRVSVVGEFNFWDGRRHVMRKPGADGVWTLFVPGLGEGVAYKYEILGPDGALLPPKADPVGFGAERPPGNASVVRDLRGHAWSDADWMETRGGRHARTAPISIYEVHLGSWRRKAHGRPISYAEAAEELVSYTADMGFTHIELLPISEHPFDGSWGYQPVGLFAPTARHGTPEEFRRLVDAAHRAGIGIILDWVPGHFPTDPHGLGRFDGTPLYEHADPREGFHPDWNTLIYDYGRSEVASFLVSNARFWLEEYHADGLRVDAVASMLYRDFSRAEGEWIPNADGGRENYEAIAMLRAMNAATQTASDGTMRVAEESNGHPGVTAVPAEGGLGFDYKWNMGWMHDTLDYMSRDAPERRHRHHQLTFGLTYAFSEAFILALSHDEVVHGKRSMLGRMPGPDPRKFANLRAYFGFMWGHPGKKLLFMGQEFGQRSEWNHDDQLDWTALDDPAHSGVQKLVRDLNELYRQTPALHARDTEAEGFQWIEADDTARSVYAWIRRGFAHDPDVVVICNFSDEPQQDYRLGLPREGRWREALNTDAGIYGGGDRGNMGGVDATATPSHGQPASAAFTLPPLATLVLVHQG